MGGPWGKATDDALGADVTLSGTSSSGRPLSVSSASPEGRSASSSLFLLKSRIREMLTRVREIDTRMVRRDEVSVVRRVAKGKASIGEEEEER